MDTMYRFDVSSIRCLRYLRIKLGVEQPLTVLVGDGPMGRSSALEGLALLKSVVDGPEALAERLKRFQDPEALCRRGVNEMVLSVMFFDPDLEVGSYVVFMLAFRRDEGVFHLQGETIQHPGEGDEHLLVRLGEIYGFRAATQPAWRRERKAPPVMSVPLDKIVLHMRLPEPVATAVARIKRLVSRFDIVFDLNLRCADPARPDDAEARAQNIAQEWSAIQAEGEGSWQRALSLARVVLGPALGAITLSPAGLTLSFAGDPTSIPAAGLPQDQLTWLATIPLIFQQPHKSLLALDQPERQLSPLALATLIRELKRVGVPILVTTESNVPLQLLDDAADGLYVGVMEEPDRAVYYRPEPERAREALRRHGDLAWARASGAIHTLLGAPEPDDLAERPEKKQEVEVPVGAFRR